jgi:hypothetical protein
MTDISVQKTTTTAKRVRGRPFAKGQFGNPAGRPRGSKNRSTRAAQLLLDGETTALSRPLGGALSAADQQRGRHPWRDKAVADAVGRGGITPGEGFALSQMIESFLRAIDASDFDNCLRQLEDAQSDTPSRSLWVYAPLKPGRLLPSRLLPSRLLPSRLLPSRLLPSRLLPSRLLNVARRQRSVPNLELELEPHSRYSGRQQTDSGIAAVTAPRRGAATQDFRGGAKPIALLSLQKTAKTAGSERGLGAARSARVNYTRSTPKAQRRAI